MESIIYESKNLISERKEPVSVDELFEKLNNAHFINDEDIHFSLAKIQSELIMDGRFITINSKWDLKDNYTMEEINRIKAKEFEFFGDDVEDDLEDELEKEMDTVTNQIFEDEINNDDHDDIEEIIDIDSVEDEIE